MKQAFTLIELLIVVLIIGILAAIAMPQYQKTVEKARATQALTLLKSLGEAQERYYMANGEYATSFDKLDVSLPESFVPGDPFYTYQTTDGHSNGDWSMSILTEKGYEGSLLIGHPNGHLYQGAGFGYTPFFATEVNANRRGKIICREHFGLGSVFQGEPGEYCQKLFSGSLEQDFSSVRVYLLPF